MASHRESSIVVWPTVVGSASRTSRRGAHAVTCRKRSSSSLRKKTLMKENSSVGIALQTKSQQVCGRVSLITRIVALCIGYIKYGTQEYEPNVVFFASGLLFFPLDWFSLLFHSLTQNHVHLNPK